MHHNNSTNNGRCLMLFINIKTVKSIPQTNSRHIIEKLVSCQVCLMSLSLNCNLTKHSRIHAGVKPYFL